LKQHPEFYDTSFKKLYGAYTGNLTDINPRTFTDFGGTLPEEDVLNVDGIKAAKRILNVLSETNSDVEFCPSIPQMGMSRF
jgi:hypothetical protein